MPVSVDIAIWDTRPGPIEIFCTGFPRDALRPEKLRRETQLLREKRRTRMLGWLLCMLVLHVNSWVDGNHAFPMPVGPRDYYHRVPGHFHVHNDGVKSKNRA